jgi:hypothetical protein
MGLAWVVLLLGITFDDAPGGESYDGDGGTIDYGVDFVVPGSKQPHAAGGAGGATHAVAASSCPDWCETWTCDSDWCVEGSRPEPCAKCGCPKWCYSWYCSEAWCKSGGKPAVCVYCEKQEAKLLAGKRAGDGEGPVVGAGPTAGWVPDHGKMAVINGNVHLYGDSRAYLVEDYSQKSWGRHRYVRLDLQQDPLTFDLDLSGVPCGCLACVYLVAMKDGEGDDPNYCDMAENVAPGYGEGMCTEIDLLEANRHSMQTAIHTQLGGTYGSGNCDRNGCVARVGGPTAPKQNQIKYGEERKTIDSARPFRVQAAVDEEGALTVTLTQPGREVISFDKRMAGNPEGHGVPASAFFETRKAMGNLAMVASCADASPNL